MPTCIEGHASVAEDYCDVCGSPLGPPAASSTPAPVAGVKECPACAAPVSGRFCESCGHDSALPEPARHGTEPTPQPEGVVWTVIVAADREFYERVLAREGPDTVDFPPYFPERRITLQSNTALIGRGNPNQGVQPEIDLGIHPADRGVSSQHAVLRVHDSGLTITDIGSTNGTTVNDSDELLGEGEETPLADGDRIHVGAWTTIRVVQGR